MAENTHTQSYFRHTAQEFSRRCKLFGVITTSSSLNEQTDFARGGLVFRMFDPLSTSLKWVAGNVEPFRLAVSDGVITDEDAASIDRALRDFLGEEHFRILNLSQEAHLGPFAVSKADVVSYRRPTLPDSLIKELHFKLSHDQFKSFEGLTPPPISAPENEWKTLGYALDAACFFPWFGMSTRSVLATLESLKSGELPRDIEKELAHGLIGQHTLFSGGFQGEAYSYFRPRAGRKSIFADNNAAAVIEILAETGLAVADYWRHVRFLTAIRMISSASSAGFVQTLTNALLELFSPIEELSIWPIAPTNGEAVRRRIKYLNDIKCWDGYEVPVARKININYADHRKPPDFEMRLNFGDSSYLLNIEFLNDGGVNARAPKESEIHSMIAALERGVFELRAMTAPKIGSKAEPRRQLLQETANEKLESMLAYFKSGATNNKANGQRLIVWWAICKALEKGETSATINRKITNELLSEIEAANGVKISLDIPAIGSISEPIRKELKREGVKFAKVDHGKAAFSW